MSRELTNHFAGTGGRCLQGSEPCPTLGCRFHVHGDARPSQVAAAPAPPVACALKLAGRGGGMTLEAVGDVLGLTRERVRQIEAAARGKLVRRLSLLGYKPGELGLGGDPPRGGAVGPRG